MRQRREMKVVYSKHIERVAVSMSTTAHLRNAERVSDIWSSSFLKHKLTLKENRYSHDHDRLQFQPE